MEMTEMYTYMLVIPPVGDIEQVEFDRNQDKAFARIQLEASAVPGQGCYVERVFSLAIDDVMLFVDEEARLRHPAPLPNERASWLGQRNIIGPAVVTGWDRSNNIPGMTLERALEVRKMIDGAT